MVILASNYYCFENKLRGDYVEWIVNDPNITDSWIINKISLHDTFSIILKSLEEKSNV